MFLSNLRKSFLPAGLCVIIIQGCGSNGTNEIVPAAPLVERKSGFPFPTKEPEIYQGEIVINGREADKIFVARKGERWREDEYRDGKLWLTELQTDKRYSVDHQNKIFVEAVPNDKGVESFAGLPFDIYRAKQHYEFDEVGREGTLTRYKVRSNKYMPDDILIDVDTVSGLIVRQEFKSAEAEPPGYVYEIRNLSLDVDDTVFALPSGYRQVSREQFASRPVKK